jgi:hypothetical protein
MGVSTSTQARLGADMALAAAEAAASLTHPNGEYVDWGANRELRAGFDGTRAILSTGRATDLHYGLGGVGMVPGFRQHVQHRDDFRTFDVSAWDADGDSGYAMALRDEAGGVLRMTSATGAGNTVWARRPSECWKMSSGGILTFEARIRLSSTSCAFLIGLLQRTDDPIGEYTASTPGVQDGVFIYKPAATTSIQIVTVKNGTASEGAVVAVADTDWMWLAFRLDGLTSATPYAEGLAATANDTNLPDDEELTEHFAITGNAVSLDLDVYQIDAHRPA